MRRSGSFVQTATHLLGVTLSAAANEVFDADAEPTKQDQRDAEEDATEVGRGEPRAYPAQAERARSQGDEYDGQLTEAPRSRAWPKPEGVAEERDNVPGGKTEVLRKEEGASGRSDKKAREKEPDLSQATTKADGHGADSPSTTPPFTTWRAFHGSLDSYSPDKSIPQNFAEVPAGDESTRSWHVSADAQSALPLFGDLQQLNISRLGATQFPGFTQRASLLGRNDLAKPREPDSASPFYNLFDFPGSTNPFFTFGDIPKSGEAPGASLPVQLLPVVWGDLRLPGWPEFGVTGRLKNFTLNFPGLPGLGPFPFGVLPEIPISPTLSDLLQDPLNIEQLQALFKEALTQIQENPLNAEKLKDTVDEIVRRITPQEFLLAKQIVRAHKERDATRVRGIAEAILHAAGRVGQQLKGLKEVPIGTPVENEVSASGSGFTLLGDVKEVLDIEETFTNFRSVLEQLLGPLLSALSAFPHSNWTVPSLM